MRSVIAAVSLSLFCVLPAMAAPCPGKAQFQDSFTKVNTAWDMTSNDSAKASLQNGKFVVNILAANAARIELYQGDFYDDANICMTVKDGDADKAEDQNAGIAFWGKDFNSYYIFEISTSGKFAVYRYGGGRWISPMPWTDSAAIKKGVGQVNSLRVQTKGETATLFVNDQQVSTLQGHPVDGGSLVGFYGGSSTSPCTFEFTDFAVTKP